MLGTLRKHSKSVIIYVLFGVIIVVFVFTFNQAGLDTGCGGSSRAGSSAAVIRVGDSELDLSTLYMGLALSLDPPHAVNDAKTFQQEVMYRSTRFARLRGDPRFAAFVPDPRSIPSLKIRKVADDMEETWLISSEAMKLGLRVSPEEVRARIVADFSDSQTGFKKKSYEDWVRFGLRTSLARFEDFVRREILREKMIGLVVSSVVVPEREARQLAYQRKGSRRYEYLEFDPAEIAETLAEPLPSGVSIALLSVAPSAMEVEAWLSDHEDEARRYYVEHKAEYRIEPTYDFYFMRFAAPSRSAIEKVSEVDQRTALESARKESRARAEQAAAMLTGGGRELVQTFEKVAAAKSDDAVSASRGGRVAEPMPASAVRQIDQAVLAALEGLSPGKVSGVVEGDDAFYLLLLNSVTPGSDRTFEEVKGLIGRRIVARSKSVEAASRLAEEALKMASAESSLAEVARSLNVRLEAKPPIKLGETPNEVPSDLSGLLSWSPKTVSGIGESEEMVEALRVLTMEAPLANKVFMVNEKFYVVRLREDLSPIEPTSEEIETARKELEQVKQVTVYREWYRLLKTAAIASGALVEHQTLTSMIRDEVKNREEGARHSKTPGPSTTP